MPEINLNSALLNKLSKFSVSYRFDVKSHSGTNKYKKTGYNKTIGSTCIKKLKLVHIFIGNQLILNLKLSAIKAFFLQLSESNKFLMEDF